MHDGAVRLGHGRVRQFGAKSLFEKIDQFGHPRHDEVWSDAVIALRNGMNRPDGSLLDNS